MKKSLLALAALTAFAGVASAQSSVTLFGIVDLNLRNVKNGTTSLKSMSKDGINSSRLGFRGVEDLGGGLRAGFWLEGALDPDNGTAGGQQWRRRSTVSLLGGFGELRLGRDYTPTFWNHTVYDPFGTNGLGAQTNLMVVGSPAGQTIIGSGAQTLVRADNTIGYFLPAMGGLFGQGMISAAEGSPNGNKYQGLRIGYAAGPVSVAFAYGKTEVASNNDLTGMNLGGSFAMGSFTLYAQWHKYETDLPANNDQTNLMLGGVLSMGASQLKATYGQSKADGTARDAKQIALGYQYDMSKRTALYGTYSKISNGAGARFTVTGSPAPAFGGTDNKPSSAGYEFGVRHSF